LALQRKDLSLILLNEATPVIGDVAMETITETVITESAMIGHNPSTREGWGWGSEPPSPWIVWAGRPRSEMDSGSARTVDFREAAARINEFVASGKEIVGAIIRNDDGVLIHNRLLRPSPLLTKSNTLIASPWECCCSGSSAPRRAIEKLSIPTI